MELITDLAYIMVVAGMVTILFKRLKQPLVLGYIVAGFLAGPHMPYTPTVGDMENVETWSQIGVIFLMFSLGLEFSFKKIVKMGIGPVITALCIVVGMISVGSAVGWLFGWNSMNRLFLGGMMAMSSTTIIYKAFDDLGLRGQTFAKGVMSTLILEDILGILLMVILSAMAVSRQFEGMALVKSMLQLFFFLALWFIVGIFLIPLFLKKNSRFINGETLLIVSVGICFLFVILASEAGYSPAFGAFMIGSILAETLEAERIEQVTGSVKNLFGAIFFVSVGMLVDPQVLVEYWLPILVIVLAIIIGQTTLGSMSFILGGQNLRSGIKSGFSMAQIGEFAFILATLGNSLGVTSGFLYPVVVAVSIITTFLTPYMIKEADKVAEIVDGIVPKRVRYFIDKSSKGRSSSGNAEMSDIPLSWLTGTEPGYSYIEKQTVFEQKGLLYVWKSLIKQLLIQTICYSILAVAAITLSLASLLPLCRTIFTHWPGNFICGVLTLIVVSFFLRPIVVRKNHSEEVKFLKNKGKIQNILFNLTLIVRALIAVWAVYFVLNYLSPFRWYLHILLSVFIVIYIVRSEWIKLYSIRLERTFRHNLSRRDRHQSETTASTAYARRLYGKDIHISCLSIPVNSNWAGKRLCELNIGRDMGIIIVAIVRGDVRINIPDGNAILYPRDMIEVVGDDLSIENFSLLLESNCTQIKENDHNIRIRCITLSSDSPLVGKAVRDAGIRKHLRSIVIGTEMKDGSLQMITPSQVLKKGDKLWIVG